MSAEGLDALTTELRRVAEEIHAALAEEAACEARQASAGIDLDRARKARMRHQRTAAQLINSLQLGPDFWSFGRESSSP